LLPHLAAVVVERVERCDQAVVLVARARGETAACPTCGVVGHRVHGRYERSLRDVALGGIAATLRLTIRRFLCSNPECPAATFAEQIPG
jgi:transposase